MYSWQSVSICMYTLPQLGMYINLCNSQDNLHSHHPPKFPLPHGREDRKSSPCGGKQ